MGKGWIGVDFDGTLARYESGDILKYGPTHTGPPIPAMVNRVRRWMAEGINVRIFTARVYYPPENNLRKEQATLAREAIQKWCLEYIGFQLPITCEKDYDMVELWDDRAIQVISNTGESAVNRVTHKLFEFTGYVNSLLDPAEHWNIIEAVRKWHEDHR